MAKRGLMYEAGGALKTRTLSDYLYHPLARLILFMGLAGAAALVAKGGLIMGALLVILPFAFAAGALLITQPKLGLFAGLALAFLAPGLSRYIPVPWGLVIDIILVTAWLGLIFKHFRNDDWKRMKRDACLISLVWFGYIVLQLVNPEMRSATAWFYAMRGTAFYQILGFTLSYMCIREVKDYDRIFNTVILF